MITYCGETQAGTGVEMDQKSNGDTGEFTFVKEKIISNKKKKIKRALIIIAYTLVLAVLFGVDASIVFITSNDFICDLLGIEVAEKEEIRREPIVFPEDKPNITASELSPTPAATSEAQPTPTTAPTELPVSVSPEPTNVNPAGTTEAPVISGEDVTSIPTPTPVVIERRISATLEDFLSMQAEAKKLSLHVNSSLLKIITITNGVNWMNEEIEVKEELTGIIMGEDNVSLLILASYDKIQNADKLQVRFPTSVILDATVYDYDSDYNLAVLAVSLSDIPERVRKSYSMVDLRESTVIYEGLPIIALGSPNGYSGSMEYGYVTSRGSSIYITDNKIELFNTDITDNENSDGIIINYQGQLIGIITHTLKEDNNLNISTAISVSKLKPVIMKLLNGIDRIYFGIRGEDMPESVLAERGLENGVYITEVEPNSPAAAAGLKKGDILVSLGDKLITSMDNFGNVISGYEPETTVSVTVYRRSGSEITEMKFDAVLQKKMR